MGLPNHDRKQYRRKSLFEALEQRQMMAAASVPADITTGLNWLGANVKNAAIRTVAQSLFQDDGVLSRTDMISIFRKAEQVGVIRAKPLADLRAIVSHTAFFAGVSYVQQLSADVINGNAANAHYQGAVLGNMKAGVAASKLEKLVDKWFYGSDHPVATSDWMGSNGRNMTFGYSQVQGQLFVQQAGDANAVAYTDIRQGGIGDCYFLASLAETALKDPNDIVNMFIVNGDGTYTVRFLNRGAAQYVTVDSKLPTDGGALVFDGYGQQASNPNNELWVALAEKAYVQMNETGWLRTTPYGWSLPGAGKNVYNAVSGGCMFMAFSQISGDATVSNVATIYSTQGFNVLVSAFNAGDSICFGSMDSPASSQVVGDHAYAVLSVNSSNQTVTLYNPWGVNNGHDSGTITLTWYQVSQSFSYYDRTA